MKKRYAMTLMEIMIVIFIITTIVGVLGVNMKGSMEKGKAFKSVQGGRQIYEVLTMELAQGNCTEDELRKETANVLRSSGLVRNPDQLLKDGWGQPFTITCQSGEIRVRSPRYEEYATKKSLELEPFMLAANESTEPKN
ncbi:MAG: hypothetical protein ChlgKO_06460 [Chlamydiales bacterium]